MAGKTYLGRYETIKLIGEGGMGKVYLAKDTKLGRQVVVKVMHDHVACDARFRKRFEGEWALMARFQHPYVVALYDANPDDPQELCIVMEYIRGISLDTLMHRNGRLTPPRVARLLGQICEALHAAHAEGIVHRDLKPANLMVVDPDTPYEKIKVMDFGLAKQVAGTSNGLANRSQTGMDFAVGTPGYISPEQVRGETLDYRSDLYSIGVILFELLSGKLPFAREETMDVLFAHATEPPPPFADVGAGDWVPPAVEEVVMACLAKAPTDRPTSARELAERFNQAVLAAQTPITDTPVETGDGAPPAPEAGIPTETPQRGYDPNAVVHHLEAWMPDTIATFKLRGFVHDINGEVIESVPGRIRVRIGGKKGAFSWLGLGGSSTIDLELHLERNNPKTPNLLHITVVMTAPDRKGPPTQAWRERCNDIFCELRGYLAGVVVQS